MVETSPQHALGPGPVDELERRRQLERERARRYRENLRHRAGAAFPAPPPPGSKFPPPPPEAPSSSSPELRTRPTRPLEQIGSSPEAFERIPPHVDAPPPPPRPDVAPDADPKGARKVAAIVSTVFGFAAMDALSNIDISQAPLPDEMKAKVTPDAIAKAVAAASAHVYGCTERSCLRWGVGLTIPYEDELTSLGAVAFSALYFRAKLTRPPAPAAATPRTSRTSRTSRTAPAAFGIDPYAPLTVDDEDNR